MDSFLYEHEVAIVCIMKNEGDYVEEWLDYHIAAGVTKFYIYDNDSEDNLREILAPYTDAGIVEYTFYPGVLAQIAAYNDAIGRHRFDCRYMAFIDADEFIYPCGGTNKSIPDVLREIFSEFPNAGGLAINLRLYGSSGHEFKDTSSGVLERFIRRGNDGIPENEGVKSIVNPRCVEIFVNPHFAVYFWGRRAVDEHGNTVATYKNPRNTADIIRIR